MMDPKAIICEFNPFHNGHKAILDYAKRDGDVIVAIMSGNFTQRSECAVYDKYKRARAAVAMGADVVLELPFPWCSGGAEFFAWGAVSIAASLGIKKFIFGSETGDVEYVERAARLMESAEFAEVLAGIEDSADGAAVRQDKALEKFGIKLSSNDKLAAEYIKAARKLDIDGEFEAYLRMTDEGSYKSASNLRQMLKIGEPTDEYIPKTLADIYGDSPDADADKLTALEFNHFRLSSGENDAEIFENGGGVSGRLRSAAGKAASCEEFFSLAATKKYTDSRLRRAALFSLLGVKEKSVRMRPRFTLLLAVSKRGRAFLAENRKNEEIALLTKPSAGLELTGEAREQFELARRADEVYSLCMKRGVPSGEFLRRSAYVDMD